MSLTVGQLGDMLVSQANEKKVPISGVFELTARCNLACKMCYVCQAANDKSMMNRELSTSQWIHLAEEMRDAGMLYLLLTGGEVFLRKDFKEIYKEISNMGLRTTLFTNGTLVTPELAKILGRLRPIRMDVSLYGMSPETYFKVCRDASGFQKALQGIDLLVAEGINVVLRTTLIHDNRDDFSKFADYAESKGLKFNYVNYVFPRRGDCSTNDGVRLSPEELVLFEEEMHDCILKKNGIDINSTDEPHIDNEEARGKYRSGGMKGHNGCLAGASSCWVSWNGKMTFCGMVSEPAVSPFEEGVSFVDAWKKLSCLFEAIPECEQCRACTLYESCMSCPGRLKSETGFYDQAAQYLCEVAKYKKGYTKSSGGDGR